MENENFKSLFESSAPLFLPINKAKFVRKFIKQFIIIGVLFALIFSLGSLTEYGWIGWIIRYTLLLFIAMALIIPMVQVDNSFTIIFRGKKLGITLDRDKFILKNNNRTHQEYQWKDVSEFTVNHPNTSSDKASDSTLSKKEIKNSLNKVVSSNETDADLKEPNEIKDILGEMEKIISIESKEAVRFMVITDASKSDSGCYLLAENYGFMPEQLAVLMNHWRNRAL